MDIKQAVTNTLLTSGRSVVFSAVALCASLSALLQFHEYFITSMSAAVMLTAASSAVGAILIIPLLVSTKY
jgi:predicted RND superfamily exporter protein